MTALVRLTLAVGLAGCIAACAMPSSRAPSAAVRAPGTKVIPADRLGVAVTIGKSTKADVIAAWGETLVIRFDTGLEVWVYRVANGPPAREPSAQRTGRADTAQAPPGTSAEFVVLFTPSSLVAKTRIRPAPQPWHER